MSNKRILCGVQNGDVAYGILISPSHAWEEETKKRESLSWAFPSSISMEEVQVLIVALNPMSFFNVMIRKSNQIWMLMGFPKRGKLK